MNNLNIEKIGTSGLVKVNIRGYSAFIILEPSDTSFLTTIESSIKEHGFLTVDKIAKALQPPHLPLLSFSGHKKGVSVSSSQDLHSSFLDKEVINHLIKVPEKPPKWEFILGEDTPIIGETFPCGETFIFSKEEEETLREFQSRESSTPLKKLQKKTESLIISFHKKPKAEFTLYPSSEKAPLTKISFRGLYDVFRTLQD